jgi:hypothetical protein
VTLTEAHSPGTSGLSAPIPQFLQSTESGSEVTRTIDRIARELPLGTNQTWSSAEFGHAQRKQANRLSSAMARRRWGSLLVLLARLEDVDFGDAADLIGTSPKQLVRYVHAEITVPEVLFKKVQLIEEIVRNVQRVLDPSVIGRWLNTSIPDLDGSTPVHAIRHRRTAKVLAVARSYTEPVAYF